METPDLQRYHSEGFLVIRNLFTNSETELFDQAWKNLKEQLQSNTSTLRREARFVIGTLPDPIGSIYKHRCLVETVSQVIGEDLALYYNRLWVKDDVWTGAVQAHQDMPYFHGSTNKLSVFVARRRFDEAIGGLQILVGSHKFGNLGIRGNVELERFSDLPVAVPALQPGDILLMDFLTWHYSGKPTIGSERPVMQIVYQSSLDGSYFKDGLEGPTLVSGQWKTQHFYRYGDGVTPDVAPSPPSTGFEERIRELETKLQPIESSKQERIHELEMKLHAIEGSKGWRLLNSYRGLKKRIVS